MLSTACDVFFVCVFCAETSIKRPARVLPPLRIKQCWRRLTNWICRILIQLQSRQHRSTWHPRTPGMTQLRASQWENTESLKGLKHKAFQHYLRINMHEILRTVAARAEISYCVIKKIYVHGNKTGWFPWCVCVCLRVCVCMCVCICVCLCVCVLTAGFALCMLVRVGGWVWVNLVSLCKARQR